MVIKRVPIIDPESITKRAIVSKRLLIDFYGKKRNCKKTTEKELTKEQQDFYEEQAEKLRLNRERKFKKNKKRYFIDDKTNK